MTQFEFIFALYALLLGLSLVEVLSGLGRTLELRFAKDASDAGGESFSIGWLTPLLAIFVILDLLSFWMFSWTVRDVMAVNPATLLAVVGFASAYYLAARLVFPGDPERFRASYFADYAEQKGLEEKQALEAGMNEMSESFKEKGGEIYH